MRRHCFKCTTLCISKSEFSPLTRQDQDVKQAFPKRQPVGSSNPPVSLFIALFIDFMYLLFSQKLFKSPYFVHPTWTMLISLKNYKQCQNMSMVMLSIAWHVLKIQIFLSPSSFPRTAMLTLAWSLINVKFIKFSYAFCDVYLAF